MEVKIKSKEVLRALKDSLDNLLAFRELLSELEKRKLVEKVIAHQQKGKSYDRDRLSGEYQRYADLCKQQALYAEVRPDRSTTELLIADLQELEAVEGLLSSIYNYCGPYNEHRLLPDDLLGKLRERYNFDDSE
jgi:hypothetical protein